VLHQEPALRLAFVDDPSRVGQALSEVAEDVVGVDVERADADRYFRRAALVQVGVAGRCVLLDGVTISTMPDLDAFLDGQRLAVLHAVENDLEPLAALDVMPDHFADTAIAAALLGLPTGLQALLAAALDVELTGNKEAYQRADWAQRPLSDGMAAYAAGDVVHLPDLWRVLADRLQETGRSDWYEQEFAWTVARAAENTRSWTRVRGAGRLDPAAKAILRALWEERERLARTHDVAPNRLVHDDILRELALSPPADANELVKRGRGRRTLLRRHSNALLDAIRRGRRAVPEEPPVERRGWTAEDRAVYDALRRARAEVAAGLGIDAGVLCASRSLTRAVAGAPEDSQELCALAELRPWQQALLADVLWDVYTRTR
jgi:ribonuclease D